MPNPPIEPGEATCRTCIHYVNDDRAQDETGECRRHAPFPRVALASDEEEYVVIWPTVGNGDWCGEWDHFEDEGDGEEDEDDADDDQKGDPGTRAASHRK